MMMMLMMMMMKRRVLAETETESERIGCESEDVMSLFSLQQQILDQIVSVLNRLLVLVEVG